MFWGVGQNEFHKAVSQEQLAGVGAHYATLTHSPTTSFPFAYFNESSSLTFDSASECDVVGISGKKNSNQQKISPVPL